jgi:hypothetical protein
MPHHGMTPHISGTPLSAQARYAAGTREILSAFSRSDIRNEYLIVDGGKLAGKTEAKLSDVTALCGQVECAESTVSKKVEAFGPYQRFGSHNQRTTHAYQRTIKKYAAHR